MDFRRSLQPFVVASLVCLLSPLPAMGQSVAISLTKPAGATVYGTDPVTVSGSLSIGSVGIGGALVTVQIINPSGAIYQQTTTLTDSGGEFALNISMPANAPLGAYVVRAYYGSAMAQDTFVLSPSALSILEASWTIGDYGYVQTGSVVPDKVFNLTNSALTAHSATITHPSFISFGTNTSGFTVNVPAQSTVYLVVTDVTTTPEGDYFGDIIVNSTTNGILFVPVAMKVRDTLAPEVHVTPVGWQEETTKNVDTTQSFRVINNGTQGVEVSVSESIPRIVIVDAWASSFFLPPDTSRAFRAEADTSTKGQILGNIVVDPTGLSSINIPVNVTVVNRPPTVQVNAPANDTTHVGIVSIAISGSDPDDDLVTYYITLVNATNPSNRSSYAGQTYDWDTQASPEGWYYVIGNATDGEDEAYDMIAVQVIHNRPPTASTPSASNIAGSHSFRVTSSISDPDGDAVSATLYHRPAGSVSPWSTRTMSGTAPGTYSATISTSDYSVGASVEFYVLAQDPKGATFQTSTSSHSIPNTAPIVSTPVIVAGTGHSFTVSSSVADAEGDSLSAALRHRPFGTLIWNQKAMGISGSTATAQISALDGYAPGELIDLQVVASDPYSSRTSPIQTASLSNAPPQIFGIEESPGSGHTLQVRAQVTDPDGDPVTTVKLYFREAGGSFTTKDMVLTSGKYQATIAPSDGISVAATLQYRIAAKDTYEAENQTGIFSSQLGNENPSIGTPAFTDSTNQHVFSVSFPVSDADGDAIQSATLKHKIFGSATWTSTALTIGSGKASGSVGVQHGYLPIHTIELVAEVEDEYGGTSTSPSYTHSVPNKPPAITEVNISGAADQHLTTIGASASDPEGDTILQILMEHRPQGSAGWSTKTMTLVVSNASATLAVEDGYTPNDVIEIRLTVSDQYGAASTSPAQTLSLPNGEPSATKPTYISRAGHKLDVASTLSDIEGDSVTGVLQHRRLGSSEWKEANMTVQGNAASYTITSLSGYIPQQSLEFRVKVIDQYNGTGYSEITQARLPNRLPVPGTLTIEDEDGSHSFYAQITAGDQDLDRLFPTCQFRKANSTTWETFYVSDRVKIPGELGETYEVRFEIYDGYEKAYSSIVTHEAPNSGPTIAIDEPLNGSILTGLQTITIDSFDPEGDALQLEIRMNGGVLSTSPTYSWSTFDNPDAWYTLTATITDGFLSNTTSVTVQVDNTPVEITSVTVSEVFLKVGDRLTVNAQMTDFTGIEATSVEVEGHVFELRDDGLNDDGLPGDGTFGAAFDFPDVTEGNTTLTISATDLGGNFVEAYAEIAVDKTDPTIHSVQTDRNFTSTFDPFFEATVVAEDNYDILEVSFGGVLLNRTDVSTWSGSLRTVDDEGTYEFEVIARDLAGRTQTVMYGPVVVDNSVPVVTAPSPSQELAKAGDRIQIIVTCSDPLAGIEKVTFALVSHMSEETTHLTMELFDDGEHGDGEAGDGVFGNTFDLDQALADGNYTCLITSYDNSGNVVEDRNSWIIVDNTAPDMTIKLPSQAEPVDGGFGVRILSTDANGIDKVVLTLNGTKVLETQETEHIWVPDLGEMVGRSVLEVTVYDRLGHNSSTSLPLWVVRDGWVQSGSEETGDLMTFMPSRGYSVPLKVVTATYAELPSKENNYTARLEPGGLTGDWVYFEVKVESNSTILFLADEQNEKLSEDQWWEQNVTGVRMLHVTSLSEPITIQFEPPAGGVPWSLLLKIALAVALVGLSYFVARGYLPALPRKLPGRRPAERPFVPRPIEIGPPGREVPTRARPAVELRLPREVPRPTKPPTRPERPPTPPPTKPPTRPERPPTPPPTKPPTREEPSRVSVPRPTARMPERPYVPEKPREAVAPPKESALGSISSRLKKAFRRRRRGL